MFRHLAHAFLISQVRDVHWPEPYPTADLKYFENVDFKQHFREFYLFFLPLFVFFLALALAIWVTVQPKKVKKEDEPPVLAGDRLVGLLNPGLKEWVFDPAFAVLSPIEMAMAPRAIRFDSPMGSAHSALTYNAQPFLTTRHLGDDLNGIGGSNSDLGDPVYAIADGNVIYRGWPSAGWGNVIILLHELPDGRMLESFYGHLEEIDVFVGQQIRRGEKIGKVGNADGKYLAHLHFEMRTSPTLDCGAGYADSALDRLSGEFSIIKWRGRPDHLLSPPPKGEAPEPGAIGVEVQP